MSSNLPHIDVHALQSWQDEGRKFVLLDVREPHERQISVLQGDTHIRMRDVPAHLDDLPRDMPIVVYCRTGGRSGQIAEYLLAAEFEEVYNLEGGINRWAEEIDPSMEVY